MQEANGKKSRNNKCRLSKIKETLINGKNKNLIIRGVFRSNSYNSISSIAIYDVAKNYTANK